MYNNDVNTVRTRNFIYFISFPFVNVKLGDYDNVV